MKGAFEKRVFVFFFIATFFLVLVLFLFAWQIVRYGIRTHENNQISKDTIHISNQFNRYTLERTNALKGIITQTDLITAITRNDTAKIVQIFDRQASGRFPNILFYTSETEVIYGRRNIFIEKYVEELFIDGRLRRFSDTHFFPISSGSDVFLLFYEFVYANMQDELDIELDSINSKKQLVGIIINVEPFELNKLALNEELKAVLITHIDDLEFTFLPSDFKQNLNSLKREINNVTSDFKNREIIKSGIEQAAGIIINYDLFNNPTMFVITPYIRDLNTFAHKSLLVFILILTAFALIMISLTGTWFSRKIIQPVKDVSVKMNEIEKNPSNLKPMLAKYQGILGDLIETFNSMNSSLSQYSNSLLEYKIITNSLDTGILWMNSDFEVILCNPSILRIFNAKDDYDILGHNIVSLTGIDKYKQEKAKSSGLFLSNYRLRIDGGVKYIKINIFPVKNSTAESDLRYISSITDITKETTETKARQALEMELIKSNRLAELGRLVEGIVHNINSPLNVIVGYTQLLQRDIGANSDLDKIIAASNNIAANVKKLLMKIREDSIAMMRPINLNAIIEQELDMCKHNIFFLHNVALKKDLAVPDCSVNAAHADISICIANILNNAIQSMKDSPHKELSIKTYKKDNYAAVEIKDTGKGLNTEEIPLLFETDFSTKYKSGEGFGLGLPISKSFIEKYKGYITVDSEFGKGSVFTIYLPCSNS